MRTVGGVPGLERRAGSAEIITVTYLVRWPVWWPRLTRDERAAYGTERTASEKARWPRNVVIAAAVHASFALADRQVVPDVLPVALVLRLGVVVPLILLALPVCLALHRRGRHLTSELVQGSVALGLAASVCVVMVVTTSPLAIAYFAGLFTVMTFFALALRVRVAVVIGTLVLTALMAVTATHTTQVLSATVQSQVSGVFLATAALLVVMVVSREVDLRRSFLLRSRLRETVAELARLTELDELTRVPNRRALVAQLEAWDADGTWGAAVVVDVDRSKRLKDEHGHGAGDDCLRSVATALDAAARACGGTVARYGGEEFAVLLPHLDVASAERAVQRLRRDAAGCRTDHLAVTVSAGWAFASPRELVAGWTLLERADAAALAAKAAGRDRAVRWKPPAVLLVEPRSTSEATGSH